MYAVLRTTLRPLRFGDDVTPLLSLFDYTIAFAAAFVAGGVNSVAGGGTMLSFPALVGIGLPALIANATNTIGLVPGSAGSVWGFRRELVRVRRYYWWLLVPGMLGGLVGAILLRCTPSGVFDWLVPWLVLFATVLFIIQAPVRKRIEMTIARRRAATGSQAADGASIASAEARVAELQTNLRAGSSSGTEAIVQQVVGDSISAGDFPATGERSLPKLAAVAMVVQFIVGVYGGYFGAGISIIMLAVLGIMGMTDILEMNAMTSVLSGCINGVAGILFAAAGLVRWPFIAVMAVGSLLGGYLAAGVARKIGKTAIRRFIIGWGVTIAIVMFWRVLKR